MPDSLRSHDLRIFDLRERPDLLDPVAEAVWAAFWRHKGHPLAALRSGFLPHLQPGALPFTLAALAGDGAFAGTVSLIRTDEPDRADLAPWLAALWVEPGYRQRGLGAALVAEIERRAAALGIARLYLSARPAVQGFYERRGWQVIDSDIGEFKLAVLERIVAP